MRNITLAMRQWNVSLIVIYSILYVRLFLSIERNAQRDKSGLSANKIDISLLKVYNVKEIVCNG